MLRHPTLLVPALVLAVSSAASAASPDDVAEACGAGTNLPEPLCACIGEESADLSDDQRAFYVASVNKDEAETTRLRLAMSPNDLIAVVTFMRTSPTECAAKNS
ncbi:MAG: hypothetical protein RIC87_14035 [Kiloniellales bacterium]